MARIRSIHPGQWTDEAFVECSSDARLLALGLRNEADDNGIFEWKPKTLKMRLFPADSVDIDVLLEEVTLSGQAFRYMLGNKAYGAIRNFTKYQRPRRPSIMYPPPNPGQVPEGLSFKRYQGGNDNAPKNATPPFDGNRNASANEIPDAEIIIFPGLIERVAHRMLIVREAPPGDQRDDAFGQATMELDADGLYLRSEQWQAVWRRVDELMSSGVNAR